MADIAAATLKLARYASSLTRLPPNWSMLHLLVDVAPSGHVAVSHAANTAF